MIVELFVTISLVIVFVLLFIECWKIYLNETKLKAFRHVRGWPVVGRALYLVGKNNEQIFQTFGEESDNLSYAWLGPLCFFHVTRPEDFQVILTSDQCLKKAFPYDFLHNRTGILTSEPHIWKEHRRALNPTLGPKMINNFLPIFNENLRKMVDLMERDIGKPIDVHKSMFKSSIDTIFKASFGLDWKMQNRRGDDIHAIIMSIMEGLQLRIQRLWLWHPIYQFTHDYKHEMDKFHAFYQFVRSALETKRMQLAEKMEHGEDELTLAKENYTQNYLQKCLQMERDGKWTEENVCEEMDTIFVGSVDTSATTLSGIALMLAIHPEYQQRVVDELHDIFDEVNEEVTNDHIARMHFMDLVIKESMRHFPVVPYVGRECTADLPINGGIIPKGAQVFLDVLRLNKDPKYWGENVRDFYPERFLPENCQDNHPYLYSPFSAGKRNCIGKRYGMTSLKIALSYILRRFVLCTDLTMADVIIKPELLLKIGNENAINIKRRQW